MAGTGCLNWNRSQYPTRYGQAYNEITQKMMPAHRLAWMIAIGEIPERLFVLHKCDNRLCCNPDHLFLGTALDNMRDCISKGRRSKTRRISRPYHHNNPRGENHSCAKLTDKEVDEIRDKYRPGVVTMQKLAAEYSVSYGTINHVLSGKRLQCNRTTAAVDMRPIGPKK